MRWLRGVFFKWITGVGLLAILLSTWLAIKLTTNSRTADSTRELAHCLWSESPASLTANSAVVVGEVIILVHSRINSTLRRNAIRETWLAPRMLIGYSVQYRFLIGGLGARQVEIRTLDTEQQDHGDLLVLWDVSNSYSSLSNRTLQSMVFINRHYNFSFMLKTDDDVFLNTQRILKDLKLTSPLTDSTGVDPLVTTLSLTKGNGGRPNGTSVTHTFRTTMEECMYYRKI